MLAEAAERMSKYEWMAAAEICREALQEPEPLEGARVTDLLAKCCFKAAFQAETREDFKQKMRLAEASHETAQSLYERAGSEALSKRARARGLFAGFWLKDDAAERRSIIKQAISLADEAARIIDEEDKKGIAEAHQDLLAYLFEDIPSVAYEWELLKERFERIVHVGEKAVSEFEALGEDDGLVECLSLTLRTIAGFSQAVHEPSAFEEMARKAERLGGQGAEASKRIGRPHALCLASESSGLGAERFEGDSSRALNLYQVGLSAAEKTKDSLLIGRLSHDIVRAATLAVWIGEDSERMRAELERGIRIAPTAIRNFEISLAGGLLGWGHVAYSLCHTMLATFVETDPERKKAHLRRAVEIAGKGMTYLNYGWRGDLTSTLSRAMYFLSTMEVDPGEKTQLLKGALPIAEEAVHIFDLATPLSSYPGVLRNYLALIKAEMSSIEQDFTVKTELLHSAVSDMQQCLGIVAKWAKTPMAISGLAHYYEWYGDILLRLNQLTHETRVAQHAIDAYQDSIAHFGKLEQVGPAASASWKIARVYDAQGNYNEASHAFKKAAEDYRLGAKKIPGSASAFTELAYYMDAWALIENARLRHTEEQYLLAAEVYVKAATILQSTRAWSHLSKHYTACSSLEGGEALSRQENQDASIESFSAAVNTFQEAKGKLVDKLRQAAGAQEKQELEDWLEITKGREKYCLARIELEEAKILDRKGEKEASSRKYNIASEDFGALLTEASGQQTQRELETLTLFCEAWAKMKEAEAKVSPELYARAAELFKRAKEASTKERSRLLALANASICNALESGTRFRLTRNVQLYSDIKKELETATDYYQEADLQNAADWTRATGKLFDALVYLADAATERESRKKTELFHLAEKHLQLAAKLYEQAGFPAKKSEALKHLERAREEKELLLTPVEALAENPALKGVTASPVSLIRDQALGLERFDSANVVGNLSLHQRELGVGSDLTLELEMANVGKTAATLMKLENIAAEGMELDRGKIPYRVEDNYIDMKGKRLEYLKTHEVKIPMKAMRKGAFELRPRILFVDEKGTYRSYEFDPATVTVRELGISGWLKGPK